MAVLSAHKSVQSRNVSQYREVICGVADIFYRGALLFYETDGDGVTPVPAAGTEFAGICVRPSDGATTADTTKILFATDGEWLMPMTIASAQTFNGQPICADVSAASDNPADLLTDAAATANDIVIGTGIQYVSSTSGWVDISAGARRTVQLAS